MLKATWTFAYELKIMLKMIARFLPSVTRMIDRLWKVFRRGGLKKNGIYPDELIVNQLVKSTRFLQYVIYIILSEIWCVQISSECQKNVGTENEIILKVIKNENENMWQFCNTGKKKYRKRQCKVKIKKICEK